MSLENVLDHANNLLKQRAADQRVVAIQSVIAERTRQDMKWGQQNHTPIEYLAILTEEVGELAKECVELRFAGGPRPNLRVEAVQVAAVALAIIECIDRNRFGE